MCTRRNHMHMCMAYKNVACVIHIKTYISKSSKKNCANGMRMLDAHMACYVACKCEGHAHGLRIWHPKLLHMVCAYCVRIWHEHKMCAYAIRTWHAHMACAHGMHIRRAHVACWYSLQLWAAHIWHVFMTAYRLDMWQPLLLHIACAQGLRMQHALLMYAHACAYTVHLWNWRVACPFRMRSYAYGAHGACATCVHIYHAHLICAYKCKMPIWHAHTMCAYDMHM